MTRSLFSRLPKAADATLTTRRTMFTGAAMAASEVGAGVGASVGSGVGAAAVGAAVGTGPLVAMAVAPCPGGAGAVGPDAAWSLGVNATACIR